MDVEVTSQPVPCNLCGSLSQEVLFRTGEAQPNQIVKCTDCGLMFASPRTRPADIESIRDYDPQFVFEQVNQRDRWRVEKEALQIRDYRSTREFLAREHPQRGTLVEVGSGLGYLLDSFRSDGWSTIGVEPSEGLCRFATSHFGLQSIPATLDRAGLESGTADAVIMMHVIEHVPDPVAVFRDVHRILRPGGSFVVETPRYDTLSFRLLGKRERSLSCEGHIYFFTSGSLAALAEKTGFLVRRRDYVGRSMTLDRFAYNLGVISKSPAIQRNLHRLSSSLSLNRVYLTVNIRDMQRFYLARA
jgi:SAM-dependent methyltransferase